MRHLFVHTLAFADWQTFVALGVSRCCLCCVEKAGSPLGANMVKDSALISDSWMMLYSKLTTLALQGIQIHRLMRSHISHACFARFVWDKSDDEAASGGFCRCGVHVSLLG